MTFKERYTTSEKKALDQKENTKTELTNDAFAIGEMIELLINKIEQARISSLGRKR